MSTKIGRVLLILCLLLLISIPIVSAQSSVSLLPTPWHLQWSGNAIERYQSINPNVLMGKDTLRITYDLHGYTVLPGDASAIIFDQNGWRYISLSEYGQNGMNGMQTVDIPLSEFPGLNLSQQVGLLHTRFWYPGAITVDIQSIEVLSLQTAPTATSTPTATNTVTPSPVPPTTVPANPTQVPTTVPTNTSVPPPVPTVTSTPVPQNLVFNGSFETLSNGFATNWSRNRTSITIDTTSKGNHGTKSLRFAAGKPKQEVYSNQFAVNPASVYQVQSYLRVTNGTGTAGQYMEEFNSANQWISGQWLGAVYSTGSGILTYDYVPSSNAVAFAQLQHYVDQNAAFTVYVDSVSVMLGSGSSSTPPTQTAMPTFTPTASWTPTMTSTSTPSPIPSATFTMTPTVTATPTGPLYPDAQSGNGIHWLIFCSKFGLPEYNSGNDLSWGCGGSTYDHQTVCEMIWGAERKYPHYANTTALGYLTCESTPQASIPLGVPPRSTNPRRCYVTEQSWEPMRGGYMVTGSRNIDVWFRVARCDGPSENPTPRAVKFKIDGISYGEVSGNSASISVNTANWSPGTTHEICITGASHGDEQWEIPALECYQFHMLSPGQQAPADPGFSCPGAMASLIRVGNIGVVNTVSPNPINVRHDHSNVFAVKFTMQPAQTFTVVNGPSCTSGQIWWEVCNNTGNCGWASEANGTTYNYVPNGVSLPYGASVPPPPPPPNVVPPYVVVQPPQPVTPIVPAPVIPGATYYQPGGYQYAMLFGQAVASGQASQIIADGVSSALAVLRFELPGTSGFDLACASSTSGPAKVVCVLIDTAAVAGAQILGVKIAVVNFVIQALAYPAEFIDWWLEWGLQNLDPTCTFISWINSYQPAACQ